MNKKYSRILFCFSSEKRIPFFRGMVAWCLVSILFLIGGCGGHEPITATLNLDGERELEREMVVGDSLILDVRNPGSGGYEFAGCRFDPDIIKLDGHWLEGPQEAMPGNFGRAFFQFSAVAVGESELVIKIQRPWEDKTMVEEYKRLRITVVPAPANEEEKKEQPPEPEVVILEPDQFKGETSLGDTVPVENVESGTAPEAAEEDHVHAPSHFDDAIPVPVPEPEHAPAVANDTEQGDSDPDPQGREKAGQSGESEEDDSGWFDWLPFVGDDEAENESAETSAGESSSDHGADSEASAVVSKENGGSSPKDVRAGEPSASEKKSVAGEKKSESGHEEDSGGWFDWLPF